MSHKKDFEPEEKNGVYLFGIKDQYEGVTVHAGPEVNTWAESVYINGRKLGFDRYVEVEVDDYEFRENDYGHQCLYLTIEE